MTLTDPKFYQKPWVRGVQTFKLQLPKKKGSTGGYPEPH
jgi:hypothetical protein